MASVTLKDLPPDLHETLRGEAEANHRSMAGEIMARLQRSLDAERATQRDQTWINEALESGPEAAFSRQKFNAAVQLGLANAKTESGLTQLATHPQFYRDVAQEIEYLATKAGADTALRWSEALDRTIQTPGRSPRAGPATGSIFSRTVCRSWRLQNFRRWLVFYAVREKTVVLLRVRYGMMDLPALNFES